MLPESQNVPPTEIYNAQRNDILIAFEINQGFIAPSKSSSSVPYTTFAGMGLYAPKDGPTYRIRPKETRFDQTLLSPGNLVIEDANMRDAGIKDSGRARRRLSHAQSKIRDFWQ